MTMNSNNVYETIQLLDGTKLTKSELLIIEFKKDCTTYADALYELTLIFGTKDTMESINLHSFIIGLKPTFSPSYLQCGIGLYNLGLPEFSVSNEFIGQFKLLRKQLFIKSLQLNEPSDPLNCSNITSDNTIAWYYLTLEMNDDTELQFGKTRIEILKSIYAQGPPTFSKVL